MTKEEYEASLYLAHHGTKGMRWGIRKYQNEDGSYKPGAEHRYDPEGTNPRRKKIADTVSNIKNKASNVDWKKAAKVGAAIAGTALVAYGAYKVSKNMPLIKKGLNTLKESRYDIKKINVEHKAAKETIENMFKPNSGYDPLADKDNSIINKAISEAKTRAGNDLDISRGIKEANFEYKPGNRRFAKEWAQYTQAEAAYNLGKGPKPKELSAGALAFGKEKEKRNAKGFLDTIAKDPSWNEYLSKNQIEDLKKTAGGDSASRAREAIYKISSSTTKQPSSKSDSVKKVIESAKDKAVSNSKKNSIPTLTLNSGKSSDSGVDYNAQIIQTLNAMRKMERAQNQSNGSKRNQNRR